MSVAVRAAAPTDRDAWARLFVDYGVFYETAFDETVLSGVWTWIMDASHQVGAVVAVDDAGDLVGFAHFRRQADMFTAGTGWTLDDLYVSPEARGSGAATALIDAVADAATAGGGGTLRWITAADNTRAQRVYDRVATRAGWVTYERKLG
jgi:ribosomal protein S18 acetylase RimI-like enzyme